MYQSNIADLEAEFETDFLPTFIPQGGLPAEEFTDWKALKRAGYDTRTNFKYDHERIIRKDERSHAVYIERKVVTAAEWRAMAVQMDEQCRDPDLSHKQQARVKANFERIKAHRLPGRRFELITKRIPVFHESQTEPGNFRDRTKAIIRFGQVFWRTSQSSNYIKKNLDPEKYDAKWFTKDFDQRDFEFESFEFFTERKLLEHINQRNIYGVKPDPRKLQRWAGADLDLHVEKGGDPDIFLRQVEAVLTFLHGKGWIVCLGTGLVNGIHVIKLFDQPRQLAVVRAEVRAVLDEISRQHPELEAEAEAAGMKPIRQAEVFPDPGRGFRLPLGIGYTALTNRPLTLVKYHAYRGVALYGADVVGLMTWDGREMPLEEKLRYVRDRVPRDNGELEARAKKTLSTITAKRRKAEAVVAKEINDRKLLGPMRGRYRQVLVDFFSGRMQVAKSLQTGILLGVNALWAQDFPFEDRADYLLDLLQQIEVTDPTFSSRLWNEEWDMILQDIQHVVHSVEKLRSDPPNKQTEQSNMILRRWAAAMNQAGFVFGDPATWGRCWDGHPSPAERGVFSADDLIDEDMEIIAGHIAPVMACPVDIAVEAVVKIINLAHVKDRAGDGMSREYRRAVLTDLGIACQENAKLATCWHVVEEAGFIYQKCGHIFNKDRAGEGRAKMYAVGSRVRDRIYRTSGGDVSFPFWLEEVLHQDMRSPWYRPVSFDEGDVLVGKEANSDWSVWTAHWLGRAIAINQSSPLSYT